MQEISVLTIGFALLSFLLGGVIVGLAVQSRSRRLQEAHAEQLRRLREEERKYFAAFEGSEFSRNDVESRLDETQRALDAGARETEILRAQLQEEQAAANESSHGSSPVSDMEPGGEQAPPGWARGASRRRARWGGKRCRRWG